MPEYAVGEIAKIANVSARTLHHYDKIGLSTPSTRAVSGYRYYTDVDVSRLHRILFFRALGLSLKEIATLLAAEQPERVTQLKTQMHLGKMHSFLQNGYRNRER